MSDQPPTDPPRHSPAGADAAGEGQARDAGGEPMAEFLSDQVFDVVMRGYSRHQVEEYVRQAEDTIAGLRDHAAELERHVRQLQRQVDEGNSPSYAGLGARVARILRMAEEEVTDLRTRARADSEELRDRVEREVDQRRRAAALQADHIITEAKRTAEELVALATADAETIRGQADEHLEKAITEIQQQRDRLHQEKTELDDRLDRLRAILAAAGPVQLDTESGHDAGDDADGGPAT